MLELASALPPKRRLGAASGALAESERSVPRGVGRALEEEEGLDEGRGEGGKGEEDEGGEVEEGGEDGVGVDHGSRRLG